MACGNSEGKENVGNNIVNWWSPSSAYDHDDLKKLKNYLCVVDFKFLLVIYNVSLFLWGF